MENDHHYRTLEDIVLTSQEAKEWLANAIVTFRVWKHDQPSHPRELLSPDGWLVTGHEFYQGGGRHYLSTLALEIHEAYKVVKTFEMCKYTTNMMADPDFQRAIQMVDQCTESPLSLALRRLVVKEEKIRVAVARSPRRTNLDNFA